MRAVLGRCRRRGGAIRVAWHTHRHRRQSCARGITTDHAQAEAPREQPAREPSVSAYLPSQPPRQTMTLVAFLQYRGEVHENQRLVNFVCPLPHRSAVSHSIHPATKLQRLNDYAECSYLSRIPPLVTNLCCIAV